MKKKNLLMTTIAIFGLATITMAQVPSYVPNTGLVGWWPFTGNAIDSSGNGNNGTVNGATLTSDRFGNPNCAYSFNGNTDFIGTPIVQSNLSEYSVSMWFKTTNGGWMFKGSRDCVGGVGSRLDIDPSTFKLLYGSDDMGYTDGSMTSNSYNDNLWHNVIGVWNGTGNALIDPNQFSVYVDGIFVSQVLATSVGNGGIGGHRPIPMSGTSNCAFGQKNCSAPGSDNFDGVMDDIGVWNRALTQQEITDLYNSCQLSVNIQPNNQTININNNVQFITASSDSMATYQWQTDLGVGFQNLNNVGQYSGTANDTLTIAIQL